jgi:hypothetical protein
MSQRIDAALERAEADGLVPTVIEVGPGLYDELYEEENIVAADVLSQPGQEALIHSPRAVTEYKGFKVSKRDGEANDYLKIV